jgi:sulfate adenylyltransferase subunit 2
LLYSIGKDSSVLLRLAQKAFYPGPIPFPPLHIDTGYKFREMIEFHDRYTAEVGVKLIVHTNRGALDEGANPFAGGTTELAGVKCRSSLAPRDRWSVHSKWRTGFMAAMDWASTDIDRNIERRRASTRWTRSCGLFAPIGALRLLRLGR